MSVNYCIKKEVLLNMKTKSCYSSFGRYFYFLKIYNVILQILYEVHYTVSVEVCLFSKEIERVLKRENYYPIDNKKIRIILYGLEPVTLEHAVLFYKIYVYLLQKYSEKELFEFLETLISSQFSLTSVPEDIIDVEKGAEWLEKSILKIKGAQN